MLTVQDCAVVTDPGNYQALQDSSVHTAGASMSLWKLAIACPRQKFTQIALCACRTMQDQRIPARGSDSRLSHRSMQVSECDRSRMPRGRGSGTVTQSRSPLN